MYLLLEKLFALLFVIASHGDHVFCITSGTHHRLKTLKKPTTQSSQAGPYDASYAVDGDFNNDNDIRPTKCTVTNNELDPYVQVDLQEYVYGGWLSTVILPVDVKVAMSIYLGNTTDPKDGSHINCANYFIFVSSSAVCRTSEPMRYLTIVMNGHNTLELCEMALFDATLENDAAKKPCKMSSYVDPLEYERLTDLILTKFARTRDPGVGMYSWIRIDLEDVYLVHEIVIHTKKGCCLRNIKTNITITFGNSLVNNGNNNPVCTSNAEFFLEEVKSYYCDKKGRYLNVALFEKILILQEIIVNPEANTNVAALRPCESNVQHINPHHRGFANSGYLGYYYVSQDVSSEKWLRVNFEQIRQIAKVIIYNNKNMLSQLVDFEIRVGNDENPDGNAYCVPGLQSLAGKLFGYFYCEPRVAGRFLYIYQRRTDKLLSIDEIGAYEESKPKIKTRSRKRAYWLPEKSSISLQCEASGYPSPVMSFVKDNVVLESNSNTLNLESLERNQSGIYECWANNTHGADYLEIYVKISGPVRVCADSNEVVYNVEGKAQDHHVLNGAQWYRFFDSESSQFLQLDADPNPKSKICSSKVIGKHPKMLDRIVDRSLCLKNTTSDCGEKLDVKIRHCGGYFAYNFPGMVEPVTGNYCFKPSTDIGRKTPVFGRAARGYALVGKVLYLEQDVEDSSRCMLMCMTEPECKSFNFSNKEKICEINNATKKEFPALYLSRSSYTYYGKTAGQLVVKPRNDL